MSKTVVLATTLPATPAKLYDMYLDAAAHSAFTGAPASIEARAGAPFRAFDGMLTGTILHLVPQRLIVQAWRSAIWADGALDSILMLNFCEDGEGARIELTHALIPDDDFAGVSEGWVEYYWTPWRSYLLGEAADS